MLSLYLLIPALRISLVMLGIGIGLLYLADFREDHNYYVYRDGGSALVAIGSALFLANMGMWTVYGLQKRRQRKTIARGRQIGQVAACA